MGYQRLWAAVTLDHVGIVLGLAMSRRARSNKDWPQLLELCALVGAVRADQDGVYDPGDPNERMLVGRTGTMRAVALHTRRHRLDRGRWNTAHRGALFHGVPMGYVVLPHGAVAVAPDEPARSVMQLVFDTFDAMGTSDGLLHDRVRHRILRPVRRRSGPKKGDLDGRRPALPTRCQRLPQPISAGAYA